jgi:hypothetical protein
MLLVPIPSLDLYKDTGEVRSVDLLDHSWLHLLIEHEPLPHSFAFLSHVL